jgi:hypothetical protein
MASPVYQSTVADRIIACRQMPRRISLGLLLALSVLALSVVAVGCATQDSSSLRQEGAPTDVQSVQSGAPIDVQSVRLTAAGHYIDLRYRVLDASRAQAALGPTVRPQLINEATGAVMAVPMTAKLGPLRQTQAVQKPGRTYFVMFVNNGGVQAGSRVTAELGELKFKHLVVE